MHMRLTNLYFGELDNLIAHLYEFESYLVEAFENRTAAKFNSIASDKLVGGPILGEL